MWKYCKNCGNKLDNDSKFCNKCGLEIGDTIDLKPNTTVNQSINDNNSNVLSIIGFISSIFGLIAAFIRAYIGITLGICAISFAVSSLKHMEIFPNMKGRGLTIASLVIGIIDVALVVMFIIIGIIVICFNT